MNTPITFNAEKTMLGYAAVGRLRGKDEFVLIASNKDTLSKLWPLIMDSVPLDLD